MGRMVSGNARFGIWPSRGRDWANGGRRRFWLLVTRCVSFWPACAVVGMCSGSRWAVCPCEARLLPCACRGVGKLARNLRQTGYAGNRGTRVPARGKGSW